MHAYPDKAINSAQLTQKLRQPSLTVEVDAVPAGILRDNDQLFDTVGRQCARLRKQILHLPAAIFAAQRRDHAVRAVVIASLGYFKICIVFRRCENAPGLIDRRVDVVETLVCMARKQLIDGVYNVVIRPRAKNTVDLWQLLQNLLLIALGKTACDQNLSDSSFLLQSAHRKNIVDGLALGRVDKPAGVDNDQLRPIWIGQDLKARLPQQIQHLLGIDLILRTAERDHANRMAHSISSIHSSSSSSRPV